MSPIARRDVASRRAGGIGTTSAKGNKNRQQRTKEVKKTELPRHTNTGNSRHKLGRNSNSSGDHTAVVLHMCTTRHMSTYIITQWFSKSILGQVNKSKKSYANTSTTSTCSAHV